MLKKIIAVIISAACIVGILSACSDSTTPSESSTQTSEKDVQTSENNVPVQDNNMRDITTMELVREMGIGINLGNTLDSNGDWIAQYGDGTVTSYETAWGSPVITKEMIQGYADEGFGVLRIPVSWSNMMGENYTINPEYMARVREIVDWTLEADMYAIINIHHDGGWVSTFPENKEECMKHFTRFWEQICDGFEDYGDKLMFEAQNEDFGWTSLYDQWNPEQYSQKEESYALVNEINQKFVDIVRNSGGNNPKRHLLITGYNTDIYPTCDPLFKMPYDPENRCAVTVHYYNPPTFAVLDEDAEWGEVRSTWGTDEDYEELYRNMDKMKETFVDKGIPVIIGEYSSPKKNKEPESITRYISAVTEAAYTRQLCPILWDIEDVFYDRDTCKMINQELKNNMMSVLEK